MYDDDCYTIRNIILEISSMYHFIQIRYCIQYTVLHLDKCASISLNYTQYLDNSTSTSLNYEQCLGNSTSTGLRKALLLVTRAKRSKAT